MFSRSQKTDIKRPSAAANIVPKGGLSKDTWSGSSSKKSAAKPNSWVENALAAIKKIGSNVAFKGQVHDTEEDILGYDGASSEYGCSREAMRERCLENSGIFDDTVHSVKTLKNPANYSNEVEKAANINEATLQEANIDNLNKTIFGGFRGKMFAKAKKNELVKVKESGINTIIDLRADATRNLDKYCAKNGLEYLNFPIVLGHDTSIDNILIENLPKFIDAIQRGDFFIGCSTGSQRTDVGLAFAYCFNPNAKTPPLMLGYASEKGVNFGKIDEALTRIYRQLTPEQKEDIGGTEMFAKKRKALKSHHKKVIGSKN